MRYTFVALLLAVSTFAVSHKGGMAHVRRSGDPTNQPPTDVEILNYALTLEYLERDFYKQALAKFSKHDFHHAGYPRYVRREFVKIGRQEKEHVAFLAGALGSLGVGECQYDFSAALETVDSFLATSRILEGVGTSAYLGAAPDISAKAYLSAAGSILTVEARHSAFINLVTGISPFPTPYDAPLNYAEVYSLAAPFIIPGTCGSSGTLPPSIQAFPKLTIKTAHPRAGRLIGFHFPISSDNRPIGDHTFYANFINGMSSIYVEIDKTSGVTRVPKGLHGVTYIVITNSANKTDSSTTIAGPGIAIL